MKKILAFFLLAIAASSPGFAENFVLKNQTSYPSKKSSAKMAVQWATSSKEVEDNNLAIIRGEKLDANTIQTITKTGKIDLNSPKKAEYFRVLVWSTGEGDPDLISNWVDIVPSKTYTIKNDQLIPAVLMSGMGC